MREKGGRFEVGGAMVVLMQCQVRVKDPFAPLSHPFSRFSEPSHTSAPTLYGLAEPQRQLLGCTGRQEAQRPLALCTAQAVRQATLHTSTHSPHPITLTLPPHLSHFPHNYTPSHTSAPTLHGLAEPQGQLLGRKGRQEAQRPQVEGQERRHGAVAEDVTRPQQRAVTCRRLHNGSGSQGGGGMVGWELLTRW